MVFAKLFSVGSKEKQHMLESIFDFNNVWKYISSKQKWRRHRKKQVVKACNLKQNDLVGEGKNVDPMRLRVELFIFV